MLVIIKGWAEFFFLNNPVRLRAQSKCLIERTPYKFHTGWSLVPDGIQIRSKSGLYEYIEFEHPGWKLIFPWSFYPTAENRHLKALFKESTCSLIIQTDFLKPLMNNGTRDEKIAIAKKCGAFPQQRTFARLYLLLKMEHHIKKSRNKLVNDIRAIATGDTFWVLAPGQYHRKQISLFCLPIITCFQLHSGKWCCSFHMSLTGEID